MDKVAVRRFLGLVLLAVLPASTLQAESSAAMLYANGPVTVNGAGVTRSAALFAGDKIQTSAAGITISAKGSTVTVPANTSVVFKGRSVELGVGGLEISTSNGMAARVNTFTVTPASNGTAKFQVARLNGMVTIAAERGSVVLSDGDNSTVVKEGTTQTAQDEQNPPTSRNGKKKAGAAPVPAAGGAVATSMASSSKMAWIAGIGAAATGTVLAIKTTGAPVSPDGR